MEGKWYHVLGLEGRWGFKVNAYKVIIDAPPKYKHVIGKSLLSMDFRDWLKSNSYFAVDVVNPIYKKDSIEFIPETKTDCPCVK